MAVTTRKPPVAFAKFAKLYADAVKRSEPPTISAFAAEIGMDATSCKARIYGENDKNPGLKKLVLAQGKTFPELVDDVTSGTGGRSRMSPEQKGALLEELF